MKQKALRSIGAFSTMKESSIKSLESIARLRQIEKDSILYYEGEKLEYAYMLVRGRVELYRMDQDDNEVFLCYVDDKSKEARLINAFGSFDSYEAAASVRGLETSEIILMPLNALKQLVQNNAEIASAFLGEFMDKVMIFKRYVNFNEMYDSTTRVAYLLQTQLERFNRVQRQVIARELNIKLETLSRILQKMLAQGFIQKNKYGDIRIKDSQIFNAMCENIKLPQVIKRDF